MCEAAWGSIMRGIAEILKVRKLERGVRARCGKGGRVVQITDRVVRTVKISAERSKACTSI